MACGVPNYNYAVALLKMNIWGTPIIIIKTRQDYE